MVERGRLSVPAGRPIRSVREYDPSGSGSWRTSSVWRRTNSYRSGEELLQSVRSNRGEKQSELARRKEAVESAAIRAAVGTIQAERYREEIRQVRDAERMERRKRRREARRRRAQFSAQSK